MGVLIIGATRTDVTSDDSVAFARAMGTFRWLRDRYTLIQVVSGVVLVALGVLLFFHRDWWLHVAVNRVLDGIGLTSP